jgi:hypothetical protein
VDNDDVPNFADGFDKWGNSGANAGGTFTPVILEVAEPVDLSAVKIKFTYSESDPDGVGRTGTGTPSDPYIYAPAVGHLRVWKKDGSDDRIKAAANAGGDYVMPDVDYTAADLGIGAARVVTLYVEGIDKSATLGDQEIKVEMDPDGSGAAGYQCSNAVRVTVCRADLDVDSDNNDALAAPARTDYEDQIEDDSTKPGKYIEENRGDVNSNGVPNFADGFDKWGNAGANAGGNFTPMILELTGPFDPSAQIKFTYSDSDPDGVTRTGTGTSSDPYIYAPAAGHLRIWTKDGSADRKKASAGLPGGDYVMSGVGYLAADLGGGPVITLYVEGIDTSTTQGDQEIVVEVDPNSDLPAGYVCSNAVRVTVCRVDLDIDSDNDNGVGNPERDLIEDGVEEATGTGEYGKFAMVNHNDDDRDGVPDYADLEVVVNGSVSGSEDEGQFVPLMLELQPDLDWSTVKVVFDYAGEAGLPGTTALAGSDIGNGFRDYRDAKKGKLRIWKIDTAGEARDSSKYIEPGTEYTASSLGFSDTENVKTFYIEGINEVEKSEIETTLKIGTSFECSDKVVVTVVAPNLGVNGNNDLDNSNELRTGIPDVPFLINDDDDVIEDQRGTGGKYAYNWWWGRDDGIPGVPFSTGVHQITKEGIEDLSPFTITAPASLRSKGFKFMLKMDSGILHVYPAVSGASDRREFLKTKTKANEQRGKKAQGIEVNASPADVSSLLSDGSNELVFKARGSADSSDVVWELLIEDTVGNKVAVDSVVMNLKKVRKFLVMMSARVGYDPQTYPTEDSREVPSTKFAKFKNATQLNGSNEGGDYDDGKKYYLINVHGYANDLDDSYKSGGEVFIRTFWFGYRGNFVQFSWRGDELDPLFAGNVKNAFQTSHAFLQYIDTQLQSVRSVPVEKIDVLSHSLGNQVTLDALRVHQVDFTGNRLIHNLTCIEAAIWGETFWEQVDVSYVSPSTPSITYSVDELKRNSWAFWFRQSSHPVTGGLSKLINSYNERDKALKMMRHDDSFLRNPGDHYHRQNPSGYRIPYDNDQDDGWTPTGGRNLARQQAAMVEKNSRILPAGETDVYYSQFEPCQGQQDNPTTAFDIDASSKGWRPDTHSDHWGVPLQDVWRWYDALNNEKSWPEGKEQP